MSALGACCPRLRPFRAQPVGTQLRPKWCLVPPLNARASLTPAPLPSAALTSGA